ncbi:MAG: trypsin-like serine protease [Clostridiaceae bacterium]|jgi:serine protease Do|nr:trypsin-like serine protease [Clostridiaceae bacterium]
MNMQTPNYDSGSSNKSSYDPYSNSYRNQEPPKRRGPAVIAIIATVLVVAILFTGLNLLLYRFVNKTYLDGNSNGDSNPSQRPPAIQNTEPNSGTDSENPPPLQTEKPDQTESGVVNPNFSLEEFAPPLPQEGKKLLTIPELSEKNSPATVAIYTNITTQGGFGVVQESTVSGSGFIITEDGYVITNAHVIEDHTAVYVYLDNNSRYEAAVVGSDEYADIAVLKIEGKGVSFPTVSFGDSDQVQVGELAVAIGNPTGQLRGTVTQGIISAVKRELTGSTPLRLIQTDAALNPGNSGGPLFNAYGEVIGINQLKILDDGSGQPTIQGISFAIPSNAAIPIIESLIRTGKHEWPMLGITVIALEEFDAQEKDLRYPGVLIVTVEKGSAASLAGLKSGDVVFEAEGQPVASTGELNDIKNTLDVGDSMTVKFERNGEEMEATVILQGR